MRHGILFVTFSVFLIAAFSVGNVHSANWSRSYYNLKADIWPCAVLQTQQVPGFVVAGSVRGLGATKASSSTVKTGGIVSPQLGLFLPKFLGAAQDFLVMRLDPSGDVIWSYCYSSPSTQHRQATCIKEVKGGYMVVGFAFEPSWQHNAAIVMKLSSKNGSVEWTKTYKNPAYGIIPSSAVEAEDGGIVIAGVIENEDPNPPNPDNKQDFWVLKLDASGEPVWCYGYDFGFNESAVSIVRPYVVGANGTLQLGNTFFVIGNYHNKKFNLNNQLIDRDNDVLTMEISEYGLYLSHCTFGLAGNDQATSAIWLPLPYPKHHLVITGFTNSVGSKHDFDMFAARLSWGQLGGPIWANVYESDSPAYSYSVAQTTDGNLAIAGTGSSPTSHSMAAQIMKLDKITGAHIWSQGYGDGGLGHDADFLSLYAVANAELVVGGSNKSFPSRSSDSHNIWIMHLNEDGEIKNKDPLSCPRFAIDLRHTYSLVDEMNWNCPCKCAGPPPQIGVVINDESVVSIQKLLPVKPLELCK